MMQLNSYGFNGCEYMPYNSFSVLFLHQTFSVSSIVSPRFTRVRNQHSEMVSFPYLSNRTLTIL